MIKKIIRKHVINIEYLFVLKKINSITSDLVKY